MYFNINSEIITRLRNFSDVQLLVVALIECPRDNLKRFYHSLSHFYHLIRNFLCKLSVDFETRINLIAEYDL